MKTSVLEEKTSACNLLCALVTDLKEDFFPYASATLELLLPCINYTYSEEVRNYCVSAMPPLLKCCIMALKGGKIDVHFIRSMFEAIMKEIINGFVLEDNGDNLITMVSVMTLLLEEVHGVVDQILLPEQLQVVGESCFKLLKESKTRLIERESMFLKVITSVYF